MAQQQAGDHLPPPAATTALVSRAQLATSVRLLPIWLCGSKEEPPPHISPSLLSGPTG